ncbi:MAG: hypothetical protein E5W13_32570, partial [Mesorhizobium sp.]
MILERSMTEPIAAALSAHGLMLRGGFNFAGGEETLSGLSGGAARSVLLVGQAGAAPWPHFLRWKESQSQAVANPLDTWSREVIGGVANDFG